MMTPDALDASLLLAMAHELSERPESVSLRSDLYCLLIRSLEFRGEHEQAKKVSAEHVAYLRSKRA